MKLNPDALAECGDTELDSRKRVQAVTESMILDYVHLKEALPFESAHPFSEWLNQNWNDYNEEGTSTNGQVIEGALTYWCGGRSR